MQSQFQFADVTVDHNVDRIDLVVFVPQVHLRNAGLAGRQLYLIGTDGRDGHQLGVVDHHPRNPLIERQNPARVDGQFEPFARLSDIANHLGSAASTWTAEAAQQCHAHQGHRTAAAESRAILRAIEVDVHPCTSFAWS